MKTKRSAVSVLMIIPVIILVLIGLHSCSATKKAARTNTQVAPPPPPPPPPSPAKVPGQPVPGQKEGDAYTVVDEMPMFPGGDIELLNYIVKNTKYPKEAKDKDIQGRVIIKFKINEDGSVSDAVILKGVNSLLDNEAIRVVNTIPKFVPGKLNGVPVPVWYMVPITFALKGDGPQRASRYEIKGNDTIYTYTNKMPLFVGGTEALNKFKSENIKYPSDLKALGVEGIVGVRFIIEKDGSVSDVRVMVGASPALDAEAMRVTRLMPAWQPGMEKGKKVRFLYMTSFEFLITPRKPPVIVEGEPFVVVEEMPMFPGGDSALLAYIIQNTKYPETAKQNGVEGRVIVRFCVTDLGGIDRVSILKGVDPELDAEAVRVVKTLPKFSPGKQGGKPVDVWYMVPISFGLTDSQKQGGQNVSSRTATSSLPSGYDEAPVYKGGETALYKFINSKLRYPEASKDNKVSGKVMVRFSVKADGSVDEVSVMKGVAPELDAEAVRVVKLLPAWTPGKLAGNPVKVWYSIPVTFTLK